MLRRSLLFFIFCSLLIKAQDSTISKAIKQDPPPRKHSLIKTKYPEYPLMVGFILLQKANEGDPFAQHELGLRYLLGKGFETDTAEAVKWIEKAVQKNITSARFNYAIMQNNEIGVNWNPFKAYKNFKFAAENGMPEGQYALGIFYTDNLVINRNMNEAYRWIKKAADSGLEYAKETLKEMEEMGIHGAADEIDQQTSKQNSPEQEFESASIMQTDWQFDFVDFKADTLTDEQESGMIAEILNKNKSELKNILGIKEEDKNLGSEDTTAEGLIKLAAKSGSPEALYIAGRTYEKGLINRKDIVAAVVNYIRSYRLGYVKAAKSLLKIVNDNSFFSELKEKVDKGDADAMYAWAGLAALGFDYRISNEDAFQLLKKAAEKNHVPSIIELGLNYYSDTLVKKDRNKAFEYWRKAASLGSREAKVRIAFTNILERTASSDLSGEISTLKSASSEGSVLAETALGYCYENGIGVKQHKATAAHLYRKAANRGNETAYNSLKRMYDEIRPDEEEFLIYQADNY